MEVVDGWCVGLLHRSQRRPPSDAQRNCRKLLKQEDAEPDGAKAAFVNLVQNEPRRVKNVSIYPSFPERPSRSICIPSSVRGRAVDREYPEPTKHSCPPTSW